MLIALSFIVATNTVINNNKRYFKEDFELVGKARVKLYSCSAINSRVLEEIGVRRQLTA